MNTEESRIHGVVSTHVETVVILNNKNPRPKSYVEIGIDAEEYCRIKDKKN
ncbi:MAG: hypothetical protein MJ057_01615 [Sphaerochaetaceae bacterium]|nr:hypothetical protein [Sphaerochaetaceae bacterium]